MQRWRRRTLAIPFLAAALGTACTGDIADDPRGGGVTPPLTGGKDGGNTGGTGGVTPPATGEPRAFDTSPGLRRLTRTEYAHTVFDLLGVTIDPAQTPHEQVVDSHGQIAGAQKTGYEDNELFVQLALQAADSAAPKLAPQVTCADAACFKTWATNFLLRAFRTPPSATVVTRYAAMLTASEAGETPTERLATFLAAVLSSPQFLYKKELGTAGSDPKLRKLDSYEIASRLSYLVWQSMPDAELADAAAKGTLLQPAQRLAQLDRMLKDGRARQGLRAFVADWLALFENNLPKKTAEVLKDTGADLPRVAQRSFELLVDDVLAGPERGRFPDLLTVEHAFATPALAKILGATGGSADFAKVTLKPEERRGVLMQPLVIGAHSKESGASPFPIGKFIFENLLCEQIPPPPAMFPQVEDTTTANQTLRQRLEAMTSVEPCLSCHVRIGPPGFAFLPFDPVGRFKNLDAKGQPYDTTGALVVSGAAKPIPFSSASDLAVKLAAEPAVARCLARRLFRWTYGRYETKEDALALNQLETVAEAQRAGVAALLKQIVGDTSFGLVRVR
jgi:hypothetical protein